MAQLGGGYAKIFLFLRDTTGIGAPRVKGSRKVAPNKGPMQKGAPIQTKGPPQTRSSYIQGALTDKGPM